MLFLECVDKVDVVVLVQCVFGWYTFIIIISWFLVIKKQLANELSTIHGT